MKLISILTVCGLICAQSFAQFLQHRRSEFRTPAATYLVRQNFEGAGYDNSETWGETGTGTVDEDYTGITAGEGSQCLRVNLSANQGAATNIFAARSTAYAYFMWYSASAATTADICALSDGAGTARRLTLRTNGSRQLVVLNGATASSATTDAIPQDAWVHIRVRYTQGTGSDGISEAEWSTDGTFTGSGSKFTSTTGTGTTTVDRIVLGTNAANETMDSSYDKVRVDDAVIGSNPT